MSEKIVVKNNESRLINIGTRSGAVITLQPGINHVEKEMLDDADFRGDHDEGKDSMIRRLLKQKTERGLPVLEIGDTATEDISALPTDRAVTLVRETFNRDELKRYGMQDRRPEVLEAVFAQLEATDPTKDDKGNPVKRTETKSETVTGQSNAAGGPGATPAITTGAEAGGGGAPDSRSFGSTDDKAPPSTATTNAPSPSKSEPAKSGKHGK